MRVSFQRGPLSGGHGKSKYYKGAIKAVGSDGIDHLEIGFGTNPDGRRHTIFHARIGPEHFKELALLMMEANPRAAIKAFGVAMQSVPRIP